MSPEEFYKKLVELISPKMGDAKAEEIASSAKKIAEAILNKEGEELAKLNELILITSTWMSDYQQHYLLNNLNSLKTNFLEALKPYVADDDCLVKLVEKIIDHVRSGVESNQQRIVPDLVVKEILETLEIKEPPKEEKNIEIVCGYFNLKHTIDDKVNEILVEYKTPNANDCREVNEEIDDLVEKVLLPAMDLLEEQTSAAEIIEERIKLFLQDKMHCYAQNNLLTNKGDYQVKLDEAIEMAKNVFPNSERVINFESIKEELALIYALQGLTSVMGSLNKMMLSHQAITTSYEANPQKYRQMWREQLFEILKNAKQLHLEALAEDNFKFVEHEYKIDAQKLRNLLLSLPAIMLDAFKQQPADTLKSDGQLESLEFDQFTPTIEMMSILESPNLGLAASYLSYHEQAANQPVNASQFTNTLVRSGSPIHSRRPPILPDITPSESLDNAGIQH